jgi:hypothetical protein
LGLCSGHCRTQGNKGMHMCRLTVMS